MLDEFLTDIKNQFGLLVSAESTHDCLFSPTRIASTSCQYYFLFLGVLSRTDEGRKILDKHQMLQR